LVDHSQYQCQLCQQCLGLLESSASAFKTWYPTLCSSLAWFPPVVPVSALQPSVLQHFLLPAPPVPLPLDPQHPSAAGSRSLLAPLHSPGREPWPLAVPVWRLSF